MDWLMVSGCILACWAVLRVLGGERQRLVNELPPATAAPIPAIEKAAPAKKR